MQVADRVSLSTSIRGNLPAARLRHVALGRTALAKERQVPEDHLSRPPRRGTGGRALKIIFQLKPGGIVRIITGWTL